MHSAKPVRPAGPESNSAGRKRRRLPVRRRFAGRSPAARNFVLKFLAGIDQPVSRQQGRGGRRLRRAAGKVAGIRDFLRRGARRQQHRNGNQSSQSRSAQHRLPLVIKQYSAHQGWCKQYARPGGNRIAEEVLDVVDEGRMRAEPTPGVEAVLAGEALPGWRLSGDGGGQQSDTRHWREAEAVRETKRLSLCLKGKTDPQDERRRESRELTPRDLLTGASFSLMSGPAGTARHAALEVYQDVGLLDRESLWFHGDSIEEFLGFRTISQCAGPRADNSFVMLDLASLDPSGPARQFNALWQSRKIQSGDRKTGLNLSILRCLVGHRLS